MFFVNFYLIFLICRKEEITPKIEEVKILKYKNFTFAFVIFQKLLECERLFKYLDSPNKKKLAPTKNSKGGLIEIYIAYDLLDLTLSHWYGVVLRNLPNNCTQANVKSFCENHVNGVLYVLYPMKIKTSYSSIAILKDLDDAEKLCVAVNNKEVVKNKRIKAHIHPKCCRIRRSTEKSHFFKFFVNSKLVFNKSVRESLSLVNMHNPLTKLKTFQNHSAKIESDTKGIKDVIKDNPNQSNKLATDPVEKSDENVKSIQTVNEKINNKNKEKDMYTSLLSMLSIPTASNKSQEKIDEIILNENEVNCSTKETQASNNTGEGEKTNKDGNLENFQNLQLILPFNSYINPPENNDNIDDSKIINKEQSKVKNQNLNNPSKVIKKSSNKTIEVMTNLGKMLELLTKNPNPPKPQEISLDINQNSIINKNEGGNIPIQECNQIERNLSIDDESKYIVEKNSEDSLDIEYITHDFKDKVFYEKPRQANPFAKFKETKINIDKNKKARTNEKVYDTDSKNVHNQSVNKMNSYNIQNYNSQELKFDFKSITNQGEIIEKEQNYNCQNNLENAYKSENYNLIHPRKNKFLNKNHNCKSNNNYQNSKQQNGYNLKIYPNSSRNPEYYDDTFKAYNQANKNIVSIDLSESTNIETANLYDTYQSTEQDVKGKHSDNLQNVGGLMDDLNKIFQNVIPPPIEEKLPPLPSTQPPEPEIRIPTTSDSVVVVENGEEPGQIILSSNEEDKSKPLDRNQLLTNSEQNYKKYINKKRSRSRDSRKEDSHEYRNYNSRPSHLKEDGRNYFRKEYSHKHKGHNEYREIKEGSHHNRYPYNKDYRDYKDHNDKKHYGEKNRTLKSFRSSSRSSSSSYDSTRIYISYLL